MTSEPVSNPLTGADGEDAAPSGRLAENIVYFARTLRSAGLPVGPGAVLDAIAAVEAGGIGTREDFYWTLHALFVTRHEHSIVFDQTFRIFFRKRAYLERMLASMMPQAPGPQASAPQAAARRVEDALYPKGGKPQEAKSETELDARLTLSDQERLQRKDFAQMSAAEIAAAKAAIAKLRLPLNEVMVRRRITDPHGRTIDMRRTLRASLRLGGEVIALRRLGRATKPPPVVALLDISGSMTQYTRVFLHFLHTITDVRKRVHTFLFGTRLTNVTRALKARDPDEALAACSAAVVDWSGGTRIAESLRTFNRVWSRRVLGQGAIVLLITDGLERDPDGTLAFEMDRLHRSCRRLVWLNPLLRFDAFEAKAQGIRAMLPHVDEFRPIHNLESITALADALSGRPGKTDAPRRWMQPAA